MASAYPAKSERYKPNTRTWTHCLAILFLLICWALILAVLLGSAPYTSSLTAGRAADIPWLVYINQTDTAPTSKFGLDSAGKFTLQRWGFGPWGYCAWDYNAVHMEMTAACIKQRGWELPSNNGMVPDPIGRGLSYVSEIFLILALLAAVGWWIALVTSLFHTGPAKPNPDGPAIAKREGWEGDLSFTLRGGLGWCCCAMVVVFGIIPVIVASAGVGQVNNADGLTGSIGMGSGMLIAAVVLAFATQVLAWKWTKGGLRVRKVGLRSTG